MVFVASLRQANSNVSNVVSLRFIGQGRDALAFCSSAYRQQTTGTCLCRRSVSCFLCYALRHTSRVVTLSGENDCALCATSMGERPPETKGCRGRREVVSMRGFLRDVFFLESDSNRAAWSIQQVKITGKIRLLAML